MHKFFRFPIKFILLVTLASLLLLLSFGCAGFRADPRDPSRTPVARHGQLSVQNGRLINQHGEEVQLKGVSTGGLQHYEGVVNAEAFDALAYDWGVDVVRLAMYVGEAGYATRPRLADVVERGIELAIERGMYVIVDWHVHVPGDPRHPVYAGAPDFFTRIAEKYGEYPHVIYEIMNEPNGPLDWSLDLKPYAQSMVDLIREIDPNNLIIIGTPNWSQDVDIAAADPVEGVNLAYALHFYAGTHGDALRDKARKAVELEQLVFVSEWGTSLASGDGGPFLEKSLEWLDFLDEHKISWVNWNLSNRDEISAILTALRRGNGLTVIQPQGPLRPSRVNSQGIPYWPPDEHLTESGRWVREQILAD